MPLQWNGDELSRRVKAAAKAGVDDTTREAAEEASRNHAGWHRRTGYLEQHTFSEPAVEIDGRIRGRFGTTNSGQKGVRSAFYGLFMEMRWPWLRLAAAVTFPRLAERIRARLHGG